VLKRFVDPELPNKDLVLEKLAAGVPNTLEVLEVFPNREAIVVGVSVERGLSGEL